MRPPWTPDFDFYEALFDETRVLLFVDLGAKPHVPLASHPVRLQIRIAMQGPRADGLRSPDESEALFAAEDAIVERVLAGLDAIYVGRVVAEGYTTFAFYVPREKAEAAAAPAGILGSVAPYAPEWRVEEDAAWAYYSDLLYPDAKSHVGMMSRRAADRVTGVGT